ncbi:putative uncharacterized protein DDB_G0292292 [Plodia interpunctella]|uniref:putative uncharacterized protein DDB_G0292292 n=1 Tax=Plodia interpunctella TaxID=58824 RepID=UPI002367A62A|nr:putative uncharacterized protein DDB_G0292292 [Plodia interpunctella]
MPPRTRGTKGTKSLKENIVAVDKTKTKPIGKITKPARKALADKTNSASDDNTSIEAKKQSSKQNHEVITGLENIPRPRRERRIPTRYIDNNVLNNLSNSKVQFDNETIVSIPTTHHRPAFKVISPVKINTVESPFKTPQKSFENSLVANRPKRICRLPSKLEDHSISPLKYIPVKPCHASTPIIENKSSKVTKIVKSKEKQIELPVNKIISDKRIRHKRHIDNSPEANSDSNNNAKRRLVRQKNNGQHKTSPKDKVKTAKNTSFSFRILEEKKKSSSNKDNNLDIYEFTYDPSEEPPPTKKKRKKPVKKKPAKPKTVVFKNIYDQNVSKALAALKNVVKKPNVPAVVITPAVENENTNVPQSENCVAEQNVEQKLQQKNTQVSMKESIQNTPENSNLANVNPIDKMAQNSVRVEDIAAGFEMSAEDYNDINYSPVNSPQHPKSPVIDQHQTQRSMHSKDPLNLQGDISFFDENPVASSSMNLSTRHPQASPWRIEFGNLPIKWHVNSYVKPNMTPAVESSFINFEENKKKHVYTNMVGHDEVFSALEEVQNQPNLKQTSIISFIREVVQRSAQKKKRGRSVTPTKANLFDDLTKDKTPKKSDKSVDKTSKNVDNLSGRSENSKQDQDNSNETSENRKNTKIADKDGTFFGFDDSDDQENVSPVKVNPKVRALRPRARAVLQEINAMSGPMRALTLDAKLKMAASSDAVNKMYEEIKSAADAPEFPEKDSVQKNSEVTTVDEVLADMYEDSQSMHLFEDVELVHHLKPMRKSYGKAKKVTFPQHSTSSETANVEQEENVSSEEDDLADLTFTMPTFQPEKTKKKRKTKKHKMSKKEQKALDEWAAGFNSMCEDIEEVPLNVE